MKNQPIFSRRTASRLSLLSAAVLGGSFLVLPSTAADAKGAASPLVAVRPFSAPEPTRRVALAWRKSFPRTQAVEAVRKAVLACKLPGVTLLPDAQATCG